MALHLNLLSDKENECEGLIVTPSRLMTLQSAMIDS